MRRRPCRGSLPEPQVTRFHRVPPPASKGPDRRTPSKIRAAPFKPRTTAMITATVIGALFTSLFLGALFTGNGDNAC